jgi:hypothetical protein
MAAEAMAMTDDTELRDLIAALNEAGDGLDSVLNQYKRARLLHHPRYIRALHERVRIALDWASDYLDDLREANGEILMTDSPSFIATFADGQTTRMTVNTRFDKLDVGRGIRLAQYAYESRKGKNPPEMTSARFESEGRTLATYSAEDLWKAAHGK